MDNVHRACRFVTGPCSCEAKVQNPGHDLLLTADWDAELGGELIAVVDLPPLVGLGALAETAGTLGQEAQSADDGRDGARPLQALSDQSTRAASRSAQRGQTDVVENVETVPTETSGRLTRNLLIVLGGLVVAAVILAFWITRQARGS